MNKLLKWTLAWSLSLLLSFIFLGSVYIFFYNADIFIVKNSISASIEKADRRIDEIACSKKNLNDPAFLKAREDYRKDNPGAKMPDKLKLSNCKNENNEIHIENRSTINTDFFISQYQNSPLAIFIIYSLLCLILAAPISSIIYKHFFYKNYKFSFYYDELLINSSPMLGVLGTIFSLAYFMRQSEGDVGSISELLKGGFYDASLTTIIGGVVYLTNLFLISKMQKNNG